MDTREAYFSHPAVNWSTLWALRKGLRHFRHYQTRPQTPSMGIGTAVHRLVLEPEEPEPIAFDGVRRGGMWEEWREANAGRIILTRRELDQAEAMAEAVLTHPQAVDWLMVDAEREEWLTFDRMGVECKALIDHIDSTRMIDLKTARDVSPWGMRRSCQRYGYHGQIAHYLDAAPHPVQPCIIAVGDAEPYTVVCYELPQAMIDEGRELRDDLLRQYLDLANVPEHEYPDSMTLPWDGVDTGTEVIFDA